MAEQVGMALPWQAGAEKCLLVDGGGGNGRHAAGLRVANRGTNRVIRGLARLRRQHAGSKRPVGLWTVQHRLAYVEHTAVERRFHGDFRPDASRVSYGNRNPRLHNWRTSQSATTFGLALRSRAPSAWSTAV